MKIRTDFVTNSSSSSFVAVTITKKNGEVVTGTMEGSTDYYEIPLLEGNSLEENMQFAKESIEASRDLYDLCNKLYLELLCINTTEHDRLDRIRDIETFDDVVSIRLKGKQEGSNGGHFDYLYNLETKEISGEQDYIYDWDEPTGRGLIAKRYDYQSDLNREGVFEIDNGILTKYKGYEVDVIVPEGVVGIGFFAFARNLEIENVYLPDTVKFIDERAFFGCSYLKNINLPQGLERIGSNAFEGCSEVESLDLPSTLVEIDVKSFSEMRKLREVNIPEGVSEIPYEAFYMCTSLERVTLPSTIKSIDEYAFSACGMTELVFNEGLQNIPVNAFSGCEKVKRVYLSSTVVDACSSVFSNFDSLEEIVVNENNMAYKSIDGVLFSHDLRWLIKYPECKKGKKYTVPSTVEYISEYAFQSVDDLEEICLNEGLKRIGINGFACCDGIKKIELPSTIKTVSYGAFDACESLCELIIPNDFELDKETLEYLENVKITKK